MDTLEKMIADFKQEVDKGLYKNINTPLTSDQNSIYNKEPLYTFVESYGFPQSYICDLLLAIKSYYTIANKTNMTTHNSKWVIQTKRSFPLKDFRFIQEETKLYINDKYIGKVEYQEKDYHGCHYEVTTEKGTGFWTLEEDDAYKQLKELYI